MESKAETYEVLKALTVVQLKQICRERGISGYSKLNKDPLIQLILTGKVEAVPVSPKPVSPKLASGKSVITGTFGDRSETRLGMQINGKMAERGFTNAQLKETQEWFEAKGLKCEMVDLLSLLPPEQRTLLTGEIHAFVLVVRRGIEAFPDLKADALKTELEALNWDTQGLVRGRVVTLRARHNLCVRTEAQEPEYAAGKGRIVAYSTVPLLSMLARSIAELPTLGSPKLELELNHYFDSSKCGIGFHGDSERKFVIAFRVGETMPLVYQWYLQSEPVGEKLRIDLDHGDLYFMAEKAVGTDWKKRKIPTLRHAAGCLRYTGCPKYIDCPEYTGL